MPIFDVEFNDGTIVPVEAPQGTPESEIARLATQQLSARARPAPTASASPAAAFAEQGARRSRAQDLADVEARLAQLREYNRRKESGFLENILSGFGAGAVGVGELAALGGAAPTIPDFTPPPFPIPPTIPTIPSPLVMASLAGGPYGIKTITLDAGDKLKKNMEDVDGYGGVFHDGEPSTQDLRGAMRDSDNRQNLQLRAMADGLISTLHLGATPPAIGRTTGQNPTSFVGMNPLGNTTAHLGQQVTLGMDAQSRQDLLEAERDRISSFGDSA